MDTSDTPLNPPLCSSLKSILFLQAESIKQIITPTATRQKQSRKGRSVTTITLDVGGLSPTKNS